MGLYGKNEHGKTSVIFDSHDIYLMDIGEDTKNAPKHANAMAKPKFKRPNIAYNRVFLNSLWSGELSKWFQCNITTDRHIVECLSC